MLDVDISIGFIFDDEPARLCMLTTDDDLWTPCIRSLSIPSHIYPWDSFETRMRHWMNASDVNGIETESYEGTSAGLFSNIVSHKILSVECLFVAGDDVPFGIRLAFANDYVLCTPISDGSTFETSCFNKNGNTAHFAVLGNIQYRPIGSYEHTTK